MGRLGLSDESDTEEESEPAATPAPNNARSKSSKPQLNGKSKKSHEMSDSSPERSASSSPNLSDLEEKMKDEEQMKRADAKQMRGADDEQMTSGLLDSRMKQLRTSGFGSPEGAISSDKKKKGADVSPDPGDDHDELVAWLENAEKDKSEEKEKEAAAMKARICQREANEKAREEERLREKERQAEADRPWDVSGVPDLDQVLYRQSTAASEDPAEGPLPPPHDDKLSKLEQEILKVQQQMAEGEDHINFEMKANAEKDETAAEPVPVPVPVPEPRTKRVETKTEKSPSRKKESRSSKNSVSGSGSKDKTSPTKIGLSEYKQSNRVKVRVELDSSSSSSSKKEEVDVSSKSPGAGLDKKAKVAAADTIVKLMVPFFKSGKIGNKQVFKFTAKEFTHALLECNKTHLTSYPKYVDKFFAKSGVLNTEDEAKNKINSFRRALVSK